MQVYCMQFIQWKVNNTQDSVCRFITIYFMIDQMWRKKLNELAIIPLLYTTDDLKGA